MLSRRLSILLLAGLAAGARAQMPVVSGGPPSESFVGEQFCYSLSLTNSSATETGFGPYLRLALEPGLSFASASLVPMLPAQAVTDTFPSLPPLEVVDPVIGDTFAGPADGEFVSITLPIGSVIPNSPALSLEICADIDPAATIGTPLEITTESAFVFGDSATGAAGTDTIFGTASMQTVTPTIAIFTGKSNSAPESEVPPGHPFNYNLSVDIANGGTLDTVTLTDNLPADVILLSAPVIGSGAGCVANTVPATLPAAGASVTVTCGSTTGAAGGGDISVDLPVEVDDVLDESSCSASSVLNTVQFDATSIAGPLGPTLADNTLTTEHFSLQKGGSAGGSPVPGGTLTYTLSFQVSDYADVLGGAGNLIITDTLPDGLDANETSFELNGSTSLNGVTTVVENADGTTTITIDLGAQLTGGITASTTGSITYEADILEDYRTTDPGDPLFGQPVRGTDPFPNTVNVLHSVQPAGGGTPANNCTEGSSASISISGYTLEKELINAPVPAEYEVGDRVEFRLRATIPAGELDNVVWTDLLPLPVLSALEHGPNPTVSTTPTAACDLELGPANTAGYGPPTVTAAGGTATVPDAPNTLTIDWGRVANAATSTVVLELDVCMTVLGQRFTDGLNLANILAGVADGNLQTNVAATSAELFTPQGPELVIDKQVVSVSNGSIDGDGNASNLDAGDDVDYRLTVTNNGNGRAFDVLLTDTVPTGLTACTVDSVTFGDGATALAFSGDLFGAGLELDDADNPNTTDGAIAPTGDGGGELSDIVFVNVGCQVAGDVVPEQEINNVGEIAGYASSEGGPRYPPENDDAMITISAMSIDKGLVSGTISPTEADQGLTADGNVNDEWTIGATGQYRVEITLPEGEQELVVLRDTLDRGLAFLSCDSVNLTNVSINPANGTVLDALCSNAGQAANSNPQIVSTGGNDDQSAGRALFDLGTVSVTGTSGSTPGTVVLTYTVLVLDSSAINNGTSRNNDAEWRRDGTLIVEDSAANATVRLPQMAVTKAFSPEVGDAGDITTVSITVGADGGNNRPDGFDVLLTDVLDGNLIFQTGSFDLTACAEIPNVGPIFDGPSSTVTATWDRFTKGTNCTISFEVEVSDTSPIGATFNNTANLTYSNLELGDTVTEAGNLADDIAAPWVTDPTDSERTFNASGAATFSVVPVLVEKTLASSTETSTSAAYDPAIADITIGEVITYEITATIPDGLADNVRIFDQPLLRPYILELLDVSPITIGSDIEMQGGGAITPTVLISDRDGNGIDDQIEIDLGDIQNTVGGALADNQVVFQVRARLDDRRRNRARRRAMRNTVTVTSDTFPNVLGSLDLNVVEPRLAPSKTGSIRNGVAGDTVTFTLDIGHNGRSRAGASQVNVVDTLPSTFTNVTNLAAAGAAPGSSCTVAPTSTNIAGNVVTITFDRIPAGEICRFTYDADIDSSALLGSTIRNSVEVAYASTDEVEADELARTYSADTDFPISLSDPGLSKTVTATDNPDTPDSDGAFGPEADVTIGETVTYRLALTVPPGTIEQAEIVDQLPWPGGSPAATLELLSASVSAIGPDISNTAGVTLGAAPDTTGDTVPTDGITDSFRYDFGDITNTGASDQTIEIDVQARVVNVASNFDVDNARNAASLEFTVSGTPQVPLQASADIDLVRPDLTIAKNPNGLPDQSAADTITFTLVLEHSALSGAPAYDIVLVDDLPNPGTSNPVNFMASSACEGFVGSAPDPQTASITIDRIELGQVCTVTYDVTVDSSPISGATYTNRATATYDTTPAGTGDTLAPITDSGSFAIDRPEITKAVFSTANTDIGSAAGDALAPDVAIGDEACFHSTVTFPEGITPDTVIRDEMPAGSANGNEGIIEITSAQVFGAGSLGVTNGFTDITISDLLGGDGIDDTVEIDLGDVINPTLDNLVTSADQLVFQVCGIVVNLGPTVGSDPDTNEAGDALTNNVTLEFDPGTGVETQNATSRVDVVEPVFSVSKSIPVIEDHRATIQIDVENTGDAPAYELLITDILDDSEFDLTTIQADVIPAGFTFATSVPGAGQTQIEFASDPTAVPAELSILEIGESVSFSFTVDLADPLPDLTTTIANTAAVAGSTMPQTEPEERAVNGDATVNLGFPLLRAEKVDSLLTDADSSGGPSGGDRLRYTLTVFNDGTATGTDLDISDPISDPNLTLVVGSVVATGGTVLEGNTGGDSAVRVTFPSVAASGSVQFSFDVDVITPLPDGVTMVANQATVASQEQPDFLSDDPASGGTDDETITNLSRQADLAVTKVATPDPAVPGEVISFTMVVTNNGPDSTAAANFTDPLPATIINPSWDCVPSAGATCTAGTQALPTGGTITDTGLTIPSGGTLTYTVTGVLDAAATGTLSNTASISASDTSDPNTGNNSATANVPLTPRADVVVMKSTPTVQLSGGDTITYQISVANAGPSVAANVELFDAIPAGTTFLSADAPCAAGFPCAIGSLAPGSNIAFSLTLQLDNPYTGPDTVFNQVSATSDTADPVPGNNADSVSTPVGMAPIADVSLSKTGPASAAVDSTVTFNLTATNLGPNDAADVVINDTIPSGLTYTGGSPACAGSPGLVQCSLGTLSVGESTVLSVTFAIPASYSGPDPITNTASATSVTADPNSSNNSDSASVALGGDTVDLSMNKTGPSTVTPGDTVAYTLTVSNGGPGDATGVVVSDPVPAGLNYLDASSDSRCDLSGGAVECTVGALSSGSSTSMTVTFEVPAAYSGADPIINLASVTGNETDSNPGNNSDSAATSTGPLEPVDLAITKTGPVGTPPSNRVVYTVLVRNLDTATAQNVVISDPVPAQLTFVPGASDARCSLVGVAVECTLATLTGGGSSSLQLAFDVPLSYTGPDPIANTASVSADNPETDASNNSDSHSVTAPEPLAELLKSGTLADDVNGDGNLSPGDSIRYSVTVRNDGSAAMTNALFTDVPDANTLLVAGSVVTSQGTVVTGNGGGDTSIAVDLGQLDGQMTAIITYDVRVDAVLPAGTTSIDNQGLVTADQVSGEPSDDPSTTADDDPTSLALTLTPELTVTKADAVVVDPDGDGPSPGDTIEYTLTIVNGGDAGAANAILTDTPDPNSTLITGSVVTSQGTVTVGNGPADTSVAVDLGTVAGGGGSATVSFQVVVDDPLAAGVTQLENQAIVAADDVPPMFSDDPGTPPVGDPTITPLAAQPLLDAFKDAALLVDADSDGGVSPGDTLRYEITVLNQGNQDASGVVVDDSPDGNTALIVGSVSTSAGSVTSGNDPGDTVVGVDVGTLPGAGAFATVIYDVTVNAPLPAGVTQVLNQGTVTSNELPPVATDDPSTAGTDDSTVVPVTAAPRLQSTKIDTLWSDNDNDGVPSPGDELLYSVSIRNIGNGEATGIVFTDSPDGNTSLVVGSVTTTQGIISSGNTPGDSQVAIDVGALPGLGGDASIAFRVLIDAPLAAGVVAVANQGLIASDLEPILVTDDPATSAPGDPTQTPVTAAPVLNASKVDQLSVDSDGDGFASPGDTLRYTIVISNTGNVGASSVVFTDTPDVNTELVAGSVQVTPVGTVVTGNSPGDSSIDVDVGTLPGGDAVTITFDVTVNDPLAAGVFAVANQGLVSSVELPPVLTDDPVPSGPTDPTETPLVASPELIVTKRAFLTNDTASDGAASPGDTLTFIVGITNVGNQDATGTFVNDTLDPNVTLITGSAVTSRGTITAGNNPGDSRVEVDLGVLPGNGEQAFISFDVLINDPLPAGVTEVSNQAVVTSDQLPPVLSDDPLPPGTEDPTIIVVTTVPLADLLKAVTLFDDADGNGSASPGDTLLYQITISNDGNVGLTGLRFTDTPDSNTTLVSGSVQTTQGTILLGNGAADTSVDVDVGALAGGTSAQVAFQVIVVNPLPAGVTNVSNQGLLNSDQLPPLPSDDPDTPTIDDPTITTVTAMPVLALDKRATILTDTDGDGIAGPGDVLLYSLTLRNTGNTAATGVRLTDVPDANGDFISGSVQVSQGTVVTGNGVGDTQVVVDFQTLPGGASATAAYRVAVPDPLTPGVERLVNQATVDSDQLPTVLSDDPSTAAPIDETVVPVSATPILSATKAVFLDEDRDSDGVVSWGDVLLYRVNIVNSGNGIAQNVEFADTPDANGTLEVGSVQTSQGTVVTGNNTGDTTVFVAVGDMPSSGGSAEITYRVEIGDPLPNGVTNIQNQGLVSATGIPGVPTDDPTTTNPSDPTLTPVVPGPGDGGGGGRPVAVPAMPLWALGLLVLSILGAARSRVLRALECQTDQPWIRQRKRRRESGPTAN